MKFYSEAFYLRVGGFCFISHTDILLAYTALFLVCNGRCLRARTASSEFLRRISGNSKRQLRANCSKP